jgi:dynein heavy chain, axonemal
MVRMWIHENKRVFGDRLINRIDGDWLDSLLDEESEKTFNLTKKQIYTSQRLIFGDYMGGIDVENRIYCQVENLGDFVRKIEDFLEDYNSAVKT